VRVALAVLAGTAAMGCAVGLMATSAWLISRAAQQPLIGVLAVAVVTVRALGIGRGVLRYVERLASHDVALRGVVALRETLYRRLAAADPARVAGLRRGDLLARVGADVDALADVVVRSLLPFGVAALTCLVTSVMVTAALPAAGLVVALSLAVAGALAPLLAAIAARRAEAGAAAARTRMTDETLGLLDAKRELVVAGAAAGRLARLRDIDAILTGRLDAAARPAALAAALSTLASGAGTLAALSLGVIAVREGRLSEVMLAVVALTPLAAAETVAALPVAAAGLVRARVAAVRVLDLLDAGGGEVSRDAGLAATGSVAGPVAGVARPMVIARDLACGWPWRPPVLTGLDLDLSPGRHVAVVGGSGCGKTTLLLTLAGLLPPVGGSLALAGPGAPGRDYADIMPAVMRRTVSFTAEDAHVFTTTVRENLRVADPGADDEHLLAVARRAGLAQWLAGTEAGLDTMLGSGGAGLSGGERRRLLLSRALLAGAGVLLLDEPGEHLDAATADTLLEELFDVDDGPAVMIVTHRVSGLARADEVIVLHRGTVAARGAHDHLLRTHPPYLDTWLAEQGRVSALSG